MATNFARPSGRKTLSKQEAQRAVLEAIKAGLSVEDAMRSVGRSVHLYKKWRQEPAFAEAVDQLRSRLANQKKGEHPELPPFEEFCRKYMRQPLFDHQLRMWDVIQGEEPRDLDPSMVYEPGDPDRIMINVPPNHAKTITFSINLATYLVAVDPNIKIAIVSKKQGLAQQMLYGIKQRLTSDLYRDFQLAFAPEGGWRDEDNSWNMSMIYVAGKGDGEKDPTVQVLGIGSTIYGSRLDYVFLDDVVDRGNSSQYDAQRDWLLQEVDSRLPPDGGKMIVLGTRVAPIDLYKTLRDLRDELDEDSEESTPVFTYFAMPAVLDHGDGKPSSWVPLWPFAHERMFKADIPVLGCRHCGLQDDENSDCQDHLLEEFYVRWNGKRLSRRRARLGERLWQLVWMQVDVPDTATFPARAIEASINGMRMPGPLIPGAAGHRDEGMAGLYVVGGLDPAAAGKTAMIVAALDRRTGKRYVLDAVNRAGMHAEILIDELQRLTTRYGINEWVVETNAFQRFMSQIPQISRWLQERGVILTPHNTNKEKYDADFGIQAMAQLFLTCGTPPEGGRIGAVWHPTPETALIELPSPKRSGVIQELIGQLTVWEPQGMTRRQKTDLVMALWFTNIAFLRILGQGKQNKTHFDHPFTTKGQRALRRVVRLSDLREMLRQESA